MVKRNWVEIAAQSHTDLCIFGAIISVCEGGSIYRPQSQKLADKIISLCKKEQAVLLADYDAARAQTRGEVSDDRG